MALCWLAIFSEGYDVGVLGAILPSLAADADWKLTPIELGAFGSYTLMGMLVGGLLIGTLSDLYGRRPTFIGCLHEFGLSACSRRVGPRCVAGRMAANDPLRALGRPVGQRLGA